jgi:hypothetical protein
MNGFKVFVLLGATLAASTGPAPCAHAQERSVDLPTDVIEFLTRRATCLEWSLKTTNYELTAQAKDFLRSLKCGDIAADERAVRERYAGNPDVLATLDATWVKVVKRLPVRTPVPSDLNR